MLKLMQKLAAPSKFLKLIFCCCKGECKNIYGYIDYNLHCTVMCKECNGENWINFKKKLMKHIMLDDEFNVDYRLKINNNEF